MQNTIRVTIDKLVFGGQGMGRTDVGQVAFVWNALPGETVDAHIIKRKTGHVVAVATNIIEVSPDRIASKDSAFLSTSPWQIMTPEAEATWKRNIASETYSKIGNLILPADQIDIVEGDDDYAYRNKMEFSFVETPPPSLPLKQGEEAPSPSSSRRGLGGGAISLAFFKRGKHHKIAVDGSSLAHPSINDTAQHILHWINEQHIPIRSLKSLIVRSDNNGRTIAALFIKDELSFNTYPALETPLTGFQLYYSTHKSPASVPTKLLYDEGDDSLTTTIKSCNLSFGLLSFFQVNVPVFEKAHEDIAAFLNPKESLIDYYGGVGAISLPLSLNRPSCTIVDSSEDAIAFAKKNITQNNRVAEAICAPSEEMYDLLDDTKSLILDPPRAGLHPKLIQRILIRKPPKIVYLSCGIDTQARDIRLLSEGYRPVFIKLYNFFPRTPHIEGLIVLERV